MADYLAGEGVAVVTLELTDHEATEFERNRDGVRALLSQARDIIAAEAAETGAEYIWLDGEHVGQWRYEENSFLHPLALEVVGDVAYLLDGGRVLALPLHKASPPQLLLSPGDSVEGVRVLEPLDLASDGDSLLALDRAGDVYRYEPSAGVWSMERYDRPAGNTYDHYYVALAGAQGTGYLLETTHEQVWRFSAGQKGAAWIELPQGRDVDVSAHESSVYVLTRQMNSPLAQLWRYVDGRGDAAFAPNVTLMHPRQVVATESVVDALDRAGRRLLALDSESGNVQALYQFPDRRDVSALWADPAGGRLLLAGRDTLYFVGEPEQAATVTGGHRLEGPQPHNTDLLESLRGLQVPIEGARITSRDFQTPGAPRHYRLGVHEGLDFYGHTVGVTVNRQTKVHAVADGVVIRALLDYQPLTAAQAAAWDQRCLEMGYTPDDVVDGYRGRQVWIDHGNGLVSRYAHLGSIAPGIEEGSIVTQGQVIATVGNSGTPGSVSSQTYDVHLHLELWIGDHYAGQFLRPIEAREWIEKILR
jgi:murein DD-endopeptidase MepM/ murein hydrolase activator NlpD